MEIKPTTNGELGTEAVEVTLYLSYDQAKELSLHGEAAFFKCRRCLEVKHWSRSVLDEPGFICTDCFWKLDRPGACERCGRRPTTQDQLRKSCGQWVCSVCDKLTEDTTNVRCDWCGERWTMVDIIETVAHGDICTTCLGELREMGLGEQ